MCQAQLGVGGWQEQNCETDLVNKCLLLGGYHGLGTMLGSAEYR